MDIQKLIDDYATWLKGEISVEKFGEYYEITTPYLDYANDFLQIYVKQIDDEIYFSDDSVTIGNLKMCGFKFTPKKMAYLQQILNRYDVSLQGDELVTKTNVKKFAQKKHLFIQAILKITDMPIFTKSNSFGLFLEDVKDFFEKMDIFYSDNVQFRGKAGIAHSYDFLFQMTKSKPERLCQTINNPTKSNVSNLLFTWEDTKPSRRDDSLLIAILNDENAVYSGAEDAFSNYGVKAIEWSKMGSSKNLELLVA